MDHLDSEIRRGMRIDWDVPIGMDDGLVLRADVYRPVKDGKYPVIMTYGPYAKGLHFIDGYKGQWDIMTTAYPEIASDTSNEFQNWETVDPEKWVPDGYAVVRVDSRGAGRSPGFVDPWSARETRDYHDCIEWAGQQPWSNGKVGLNGISYYGMNQWQVAATQPRHLAAICVWEGASDFYRDMGHHGGIHNVGFSGNWAEKQVYSIQYGRGKNGFKSHINGRWVSGDVTLSDGELAANRCDFNGDVMNAKLATDEYWTSRTPDYSKIKLPILSTGNWGGHGLHLRGNTEAWLASASKEKWLEIHGDAHWNLFYAHHGVKLQKKFFGHFLKGEKTGWEKEPRVKLYIRRPGEQFEARAENEWPLARSEWKKLYLDVEGETLVDIAPKSAGTLTYEALGDGLTFLTPPFREETEITGPMAAKLWISSQTADADLFLVVRVFAPDMREITFYGANDPRQPIALGWLRASHRKLDPKKTLPYRPYHSHDEQQKLTPGDVYEVDVEILPTSIVIPPGHRLGFSVRGRDYVTTTGTGTVFGTFGKMMTGVGPFWHDNPKDRPVSVFGRKVTMHTGPSRPAHLLVPVIPGRKS